MYKELKRGYLRAQSIETPSSMFTITKSKGFTKKTLKVDKELFLFSMNPKRNIRPLFICKSPSTSFFKINLPRNLKDKNLAVMEPARSSSLANNRSYEDFDPLCKWRREEGRDILEVHLPGFRREQVKVQVNHLGFIIISGERAMIEGNRWKRFKKEIEIPTHCNSNAVTARFMQSILTVVMPKQVNPVSHADQERTTAQEYEQPREEKETAASDPKMKFTGRNPTTEETKSKFTAGDEIVKQEMDELETEADAKLTPETTREVALKVFVVVILVLLIASYVTDMCKSMVADSYFLS